MNPTVYQVTSCYMVERKCLGQGFPEKLMLDMRQTDDRSWLGEKREGCFRQEEQHVQLSWVVQVLRLEPLPRPPEGMLEQTDGPHSQTFGDFFWGWRICISDNFQMKLMLWVPENHSLRNTGLSV